MANRNHIVYRVADLLQSGFAGIDAELQTYNDRIAELHGNPRIVPEYKNRDIAKLKEERAARARQMDADLREAVQKAIGEERAALTRSITGHLPTAEQSAAIECLKRIKPTQTEFDAVADQVKGVYLCERELSDIAAEKGLKYDFAGMDLKLKHLEKLEADALPCCNYEGMRERIGEGMGSIDLGGTCHSNALMYFTGPIAKTDQYVRDYEKGSTFTERVDAPDPFDQINMLYQSNPQDEAAISKLYKGHKAYVDGTDRTDMARDSYEADLMALLPNLLDGGDGEPVNFA